MIYFATNMFYLLTDQSTTTTAINTTIRAAINPRILDLLIM